MNRYRDCYLLAIACWVLLVLFVLFGKQEVCEIVDEPVVASDLQETSPAFDVVAVEPVTYMDIFRETANKIEGCKITHYCCEKRPHICGTGDGLTATGHEVIPYHTCAVDPGVIPYGAEVMVDYGDRTEFYVAMDCGGSVKQNHIDLAVQTHEEALDLGVIYATVYWKGGYK